MLSGDLIRCNNTNTALFHEQWFDSKKININDIQKEQFAIVLWREDDEWTSKMLVLTSNSVVGWTWVDQWDRIPIS